MTRCHPGNISQDLCLRYRLRPAHQSVALQRAMHNEEDPTVVQHIQQEEDSQVAFIRQCFSYQVS